MNTERLFQVLSRVCPLSDDYRSAVEQEVRYLSLPKNYFLLEPPRVAEYAFFLTGGFAMSYTFQDGRKQVQDFWEPERFVFSVKSFFQQEPSTEFIQLVTNAEVLCFSYESTLKLLDAFPEANIIYRALMTEHFEKSQERLRDIQTLKAGERYQKLRDQFAGIDQLVSQEHIASYLGIAPQSLSRIKRSGGDGKGLRPYH